MPISWWTAPIMYVGRERTHPSCCIGASLQQFFYSMYRSVAKIKIPTLVYSHSCEDSSLWYQLRPLAVIYRNFRPQLQFLPELEPHTPLCYNRNLHCRHNYASQELVNYTIITFVSCSQGFRNLMFPTTVTFCPSIVSFMTDDNNLKSDH